ncbi:MAG: glycosyltransferase family 4 protein [Prevotella sp.]|jgi:glycosyltransferase involved in cell wall biosynthesis|nr:glycosyltransferase family 4 protein [Prevotella sp.]
MMHILYIYSEITIKGGADKVIVEKANYFAQKGYIVTLVTESQLSRELSFPLNSGVKHIDMDLDFNRQYSQGVIHRAYTYYTLMKIYKKKLELVLRQEKPDIVITTLGRSLDFITEIHDGSVKIGEAHTTKFHLRSLHLMEQKNIVYKMIANCLRRKMIRNVSKLKALVLLTPQDAADWEDDIQTYIIPNSIPSLPETFSNLDNKQVIMVGRYNDAKGYDYLIPAWEIVHHRHPDWILNVYGSGELHDDVISWIQERNLGDSIILHDPIDNIMEKYLDSSICVMSSRYEGFPMALVESLSCGVPCVSFDCPFGPRNIIIDGNDGLLVEYLNIQALAEGICKLIENDNLRRRFGENGRKNILRYSRNVVMKQWEDLFKSLTKGKES